MSGLLVSTLSSNCCRHWALLVVHSSTGARHFLHSAEGVPQGDPLAMVLHGLTVLPLIRDLKREFPDLTHVWFVDDGNACGTFQQLKAFLAHVTKKGQPFGFQLDPNKCILITSDDNQSLARHRFCRLLRSDNIVTGTAFLVALSGKMPNGTPG